MSEKVMVLFEVQGGKVEEVKVAIREFIEHIRVKEPGTLYYTSLQDRDNPRKFIHFMVFANSESHQHHRNTAYVNEFVETLYPLCSVEPEPIFLEELDSCGVVAETLARATKG